MATINNNPAHHAEVARRAQVVREKNEAMLMTGFWGGLVLGLGATVALVVTWMIYYG